MRLTQQELARRLDFSPQQISNYESGRAAIPPSVLLAAQYLEREAGGRSSPLSPPENAFVEEFAALLREKLGRDLLFLVLFGSRVRGDFHEESDLDLLIVVFKKNRSLRHTVFNLLFQIDPYQTHRLSPVIYSLKEFRENERLKSPFVGEIKRDGILV